MELLGGLLHRRDFVGRVSRVFFDRRRQCGIGFIGANLHGRNGHLRFVPHPLNFDLGLLVALGLDRLRLQLLALLLEHHVLLLEFQLRLLLEFLAIRFQQLGLFVQRLAQLLNHLAGLLQLLLQLLRVWAFSLCLQRRRQHFLDPLSGF